MDKSQKPSQISNETPKNLLQGISQVFRQLSTGFIESESDLDRREKKDIYSTIANFLQKKFQEPVDICLSAIHVLCNESDPKILSETNHSHLKSDSFSKHLKDCVHSILVRYEPINRGKLYKRQIEITFITEKRSTTKVSQEVDWDYLPPDVRERCLRYGEEVSVFEIYMQEQ